MHRVASSKGGMHPLSETETADFAMAGYVLGYDFLSRLCSIDQGAQCAPSCILCARLVGESGMLLFVLVINGGRQKPVNLGKERQFGSFVFAESPE
jgi:hypothetical protein